MDQNKKEILVDEIDPDVKIKESLEVKCRELINKNSISNGKNRRLRSPGILANKFNRITYKQELREFLVK